MLKGALRSFLDRSRVAIYRRSEIDRLLQEHQQLSDEVQKYRDRDVFYRTTEDFDSLAKTRSILDGMQDFGKADFADLSCWLFASSLINHRVLHQRIDEGSLLWRAVKLSGGPILEVGRAAGGSTLVLLGASGDREVISIDRAPYHAPISDYVFNRPDVAPRLKLYRQTSREQIDRSEFGMLFIDADHSYEGVCHDIATFWNGLKSFDGKPALAAFHDAAPNPISYLEPVKRACEELLAEQGVARVVDSWGSMLVLEKLGDISADEWFKKESYEFWEHYATPDHPVIKPITRVGQFGAHPSALRLGKKNHLGEQNVDEESWLKRGVVTECAPLAWVASDSPLRLIRESPVEGGHGIEKRVDLNLTRFNFSAFVRPLHKRHLRLSIESEVAPVAHADFDLHVDSRVQSAVAAEGVEILDASFEYRNGYFKCSLAVALRVPSASLVFAVRGLDHVGMAPEYTGSPEQGFFINLASVREIL